MKIIKLSLFLRKHTRPQSSSDTEPKLTLLLTLPQTQFSTHIRITGNKQDDIPVAKAPEIPKVKLSYMFQRKILKVSPRGMQEMVCLAMGRVIIA